MGVYTFLLHFISFQLQEIILPLYTLGILIIVKVLIPNPNYPAMTTPRENGDVFKYFNGSQNHTIAVVPNSTETLVSYQPKDQ